MNEINYDEIYRKLVKRFVVTVALLLSILLIKQTVTYYQTENAADTSYVLNLAGKQRMLSQKIIKDIVLLEKEESDLNKNRYTEDLQESLQNFKMTHYEFLDLNKHLQINSQPIDSMFPKLESSYLSLVGDAESILEVVVDSEAEISIFDRNLSQIIEHEIAFLEEMDSVVAKYEKQTHDSIYLIETTHRISFIFIIITLIFSIIQIFLPLLNYLKITLSNASESNENLLKIIQMMKGAFVLVDLEGNILFKNNDAKKLLKKERLPGETINLKTSIHWKDIEIGDLIEQAEMDNSRIENIETMIEDKDGNLVPLMISAFSSRYQGNKVVILNIFDLTVQKRTEELLKDHAIKDEMTGLYNRYILQTIVEKEFKKANSYEAPLSAILLDLDGFKQINDRWGHPIGDSILQLAARTIKNNIRKSDYAIRIGGEEFLLIMPNTNATGAVSTAEKLRKAIYQNAHPVIGNFTASFGVAECDKKETYESLYQRVDEALYMAKEQGRNRVVFKKSKS